MRCRLDEEQLSVASLKQGLSDEQFTNRKLEEKIQEMKAASSEQEKVIWIAADIRSFPTCLRLTMFFVNIHLLGIAD